MGPEWPAQRTVTVDQSRNFLWSLPEEMIMKDTHPHESEAIERPSRARRRQIPRPWMLGTAAVVLAASIGARAAPAADPAGQAGKEAQSAKEPLDEEAFAVLGEETTEKICVTCHTWDDVTRKRRTFPQWEELVVNMAGRGAKGTPTQFETVTKFLSRYYGLVHVNSATAAELSAVLGLSPKDASAIVDYRNAHGKFADATALSKVEGIDRKKIAEQPDALIFD
jgi:competence ComEA-like helix-hairpin-helix protein